MKVLVLPDAHLHLELLNKVDRLLVQHPEWFCVSLGDWADDWDMPPSMYRQFFDALVHFTEKYHDRLYLCWGNHDYGYYYNPGHHSGYVHDAKDIVRSSLRQLRLLVPIKMVQQIDDVLFSHAGVSQLWFDSYKADLENRPNQSLLDYCEDIPILQYHLLNSPLWYRPSYTKQDTFNTRFVQVVGHTYTSTVKWQADSNIIYTDTWSNDSVYNPLGDKSLVVVDTQTQTMEVIPYDK